MLLEPQDLTYEYGFILKFSCPTGNQAQEAPHRFRRTLSNSYEEKLEVKINQREINKCFKANDKRKPKQSNIQLPPVTSHICVIADSSVGTLPSCSGSADAAPGKRSTRANSL